MEGGREREETVVIFIPPIYSCVKILFTSTTRNFLFHSCFCLCSPTFYYLPLFPTLSYFWNVSQPVEAAVTLPFYYRNAYLFYFKKLLVVVVAYIIIIMKYIETEKRDQQTEWLH